MQRSRRLACTSFLYISFGVFSLPDYEEKGSGLILEEYLRMFMDDKERQKEIEEGIEGAGIDSNEFDEDEQEELADLL